MNSKNFPKGRPFDPKVPDCPFIIYSDEFLKVLGANPKLDTVVATNAHEGPVYVKDRDTLYFTTLPENINVPSPGYKTVSISKVDLKTKKVSVVRHASNMANGMTLDREGRLVICEQGTKSSLARISRLNLNTNEIESLVELWFGLPFNSPNDVVVTAIQGPGSYYPNLPHHIRAFDVANRTHLINDRLFAVVTPGIPDGLKVDSAGRIYSSSADGLKVFNPSGDLIGAIEIYNVANFAFGGPQNNIIYALNDSAIYAVHLEAEGAIQQN